MLIIALVLAVVGLAALVTAVVTSNELIAWVCIVASVIGVVLLIVDALRERSRRDGGGRSDDEREAAEFDEEYPDEAVPADDVSTDAHADRDAELDADTTAVPIDQRDDEVAREDRR
jgi:FtsZ-interacting cell division protein ZipA